VIDGVYVCIILFYLVVGLWPGYVFCIMHEALVEDTLSWIWCFVIGRVFLDVSKDFSASSSGSSSRKRNYKPNDAMPCTTPL